MNHPSFEMVVDASDNLYIGKYDGDDIFKVTPGGSVSTFTTFTGSQVGTLVYNSTTQDILTASYSGQIVKFNSA
jgi:hypothetical protein